MLVDWKPLSRPASLASLIGALMFAGWVGAKNGQFLFLDYINLAFHEFSHLFFMFGGQVLHILGGTIGQVAIPAGLAFVFLTRREVPGTAFCVLWTGESLINVSVYIGDARTMALPLVGGGEHDWNLLLGRFHLLDYDRALSIFVKTLGWMIMIGAVVWLISVGARSWTRDNRHGTMP